jgi:hypothetical protein
MPSTNRMNNNNKDVTKTGVTKTTKIKYTMTMGMTIEVTLIPLLTSLPCIA